MKARDGIDSNVERKEVKGTFRSGRDTENEKRGAPLWQ